MLDVGKKLDADTHVVWGGREGFATALNTKVMMWALVNCCVILCSFHGLSLGEVSFSVTDVTGQE